jgi:hypothetical protein
MSHPHQREVAVFEAALQLPPEQWQAYLEQTCAGDPELLERVRALLKAHEGQTDFLTSASVARSGLAASAPPAEKPGDNRR